MTIDEAIKILTDLSLSNSTWYQPGCFTATLLGIEALKRVNLERKLGTYEMNYTLPGETLQ